MEPRWGSTVAPYCWCSQGASAPLVGVLLQHLGILLTEIAIGSPVLDVNAPANASLNSLVETQLVFMTGTPLGRREEQHNETVQRVREATSEHYSRAVNYCLRSSWRRDEVRENHLIDYYWKVLIPYEP